jgi:hypothetical protein
MCIQLPNWKHTVICSNNNYKFIKNICNKISKKINIIKINKNNISIDDYSLLLSSINFWNLLTGDNILIHQSDSLIFDSVNINEWLKYDYVGAPFPKNLYESKYLVGNGAFSLRKRNTMVNICLNYDINNLPDVPEFILKYMNINNLKIIPEDLFFIKIMVDNNIGIIPDYDKALFFSTQSIKMSESLGGHLFWVNDNNWIDRFNIIIKQFYFDQNNFINTYELCRFINNSENNNIINIYKFDHKFGWNNILFNLYINDITTFFNKNNNIELIDKCEKFFVWDNKKINKKWIGITHLPPNTPSYLDLQKLNINLLFNNNSYIKSKNNCLKIITLSNYIKKYIDSKQNNIDTINIYHPINEINTKFSYDDYVNNNNKYIIHIGQQLRILKTFLYLKLDTHKKLFLCKNEKSLLNYLKQELNIDINLLDHNVEIKNSNDDYDDLLIKNIIFIHLYDTSANNIILKAIMYKVPIIVNKHPAVVEYLGEDYPLYFNYEIEVNDNFISNENILEAHNYLCNIDISKFLIKTFNENLLDLI